MANYNYKLGKKRILDCLNETSEVLELKSLPEDKDFHRYPNGVKIWVGALFVDIKNSTDYFLKQDSKIVSGVMKAFTKEVISILKDNPNYEEIGVREDCIYAIYKTPKKSDLKRILEDAILINTFNLMFKKILEEKGLKTFEFGIGLGASKDVVLKLGYQEENINDYLWLSKAVIDAKKLSSCGNRDGYYPIVMDSSFYFNIKDVEFINNEYYADYFTREYSGRIGEDCYHGDLVSNTFYNWILGGMK